jgi:hypothetical protein
MNKLIIILKSVATICMVFLFILPQPYWGYCFGIAVLTGVIAIALEDMNKIYKKL